jgi:hypothetical protein
MERKGFCPICEYVNLKPRKNEIGGIFKFDEPPKYKWSRGVFLFKAKCLERIIVRPNLK